MADPIPTDEDVAAVLGDGWERRQGFPEALAFVDERIARLEDELQMAENVRQWILDHTPEDERPRD